MKDRSAALSRARRFDLAPELDSNLMPDFSKSCYTEPRLNISCARISPNRILPTNVDTTE
jgi:hypothetical protein